MGILGKKNKYEIVEEEKSLDKIPFKEAKEIVLAPNKPNLDIELTPEQLLNNLFGKKVIVGSVVFEKKTKEEESFGEFANVGELENFFEKIKIIAEKTIPEGLVQITENTKIKLEKREAREEDIPKDKIIEVIKIPDMKEFMKVKSINDIIKLAKAGHFIHKFKSKDKTIYFLNPYYFEKID